MTSPSGLLFFTNYLLSQKDGAALAHKDFWIDSKRHGDILDSQKTFFLCQERPDTVVDVGTNILSTVSVYIHISSAYNFNFSIYEGDDEAYRADLPMVAEKTV